MDRPIAYLMITQGRVMVSYCVYDASGRLLWDTRAYPGPEGVDGARERLRAWMRATGYRVVMTTEHQEGRERGRLRAQSGSRP